MRNALRLALAALALALLTGCAADAGPGYCDAHPNNTAACPTATEAPR